MLDQIAADVKGKGGASETCSFELSSPIGREVDTDSASLVYIHADSTETLLGQVRDASACAANSYYFETNLMVTICPATCATIQADTGSSLKLDIDCLWPP